MEILEGEEKIGCITHIWPIDGSYKKKKLLESHDNDAKPQFHGVFVCLPWKIYFESQLASK
jgi:hypothetical protein